MKINQHTVGLLLRLSLATGFLSAVASRLNWWGARSLGWNHFLNYTQQVNSFLPSGLIPFIAVAATLLELVLGLLLFIGYKTQYAAAAAALLTLLFAVAMTFSFGIKEPLDYSVFVYSTAAALLSTQHHYKWSADAFFNH